MAVILIRHLVPTDWNKIFLYLPNETKDEWVD